MEQHQFSFSRQLNALWRFKWMILLVALVAGGTALMATGQQPPTYTATVTMMVESNQNLTALLTGMEPYAQDIASQIEVMKSHDVLERAVTQLEPDMADNPRQLEYEIALLKGSLSIMPYSGTKLVGISVISLDANKAQQQAVAVAEAYIYQVQTTTQEGIQTILENTTKRMHDLITREVDLSNNPQLTRLIAQFNTAIPSLETAMDQLQQLSEKTGTPTTQDPGTILTALQLDTLVQQVNDVTAEAKDLAGQAERLNVVSEESDFTERGANIAIIEGRMRVLNTKMGSLAGNVGGLEAVETDPQAQGQLRNIVEQLKISSTTGGALLDQVISLYSVQGQYRQANSGDTPNYAQIELYTESDKNLLHRITEHAGLMASSLETASSQAQQIIPRAGTLTQWRLQALVTRTSSLITMLQDISKQLMPSASLGGVLLNQSDIASLEVRGQTVTLVITSLLSDLQGAQSMGVAPDISATLVAVQDMVNEANGAIGNLGNDITNMAEQESGSLSYTALDQLRRDLQYTLLGMADSATSRIVDKAVAADSFDFFSKYKGTFLAVFAGVFIGCLIALILQYFDRTARDTSQVSDFLGIPPLTQVARVRPHDNPGGPLSVLTEQMYQCLEAFRLLRTNLAVDATRGQVLLVTSASEKEGKTTISANLARVVALQGRRVLLIDGNLRQPGVAAAFSLEAGEGLSDFLKGTREPWDYIVQADGVDIIPSGTTSATSAEMLSSPRMKTLLENAKEMFDVIILDSAPVMGCADARVLARESDAVVMVVKSDSSRLDLVKASVKALESMGARLAGFVLNKAQSRECKYLPPPGTMENKPGDVNIETPAKVA